MFRSRRHAALRRAAASVWHFRTYDCEPLEQRMLLTATGDPVIVLTEPFDLVTWANGAPPVDEEHVLPWLWKNPGQSPGENEYE